MKRADRGEIYLDPIDAYDRIACEYSRLLRERRAYLLRIEEIIVSEIRASAIPRSDESLLDIGSGDGTRALRIADQAGLKSVVLLEPSAAMRSQCHGHATIWPMRAEDLAEKSGRFAVITCLWNVLGHISPRSSRVSVLCHCARLLTPQGRLFLDFNHRYNARRYGFLRTAGRVFHDLARPSDKNGDVRVRWELAGANYTTDGHVFMHSEFSGMIHDAGLIIEKTITVDYDTGEIRRSRFLGNQLHILRLPQRRD